MCTGIVLAGGKSTRMGTNKALLKIDQELMIVKVLRQMLTVCSTCIVVTNTPDEFPVLQNVSYLKDNYLDCGPLGGLEAGFSAAGSELAAVAACDMPAISSPFLKRCLDRMDSKTDAVMVPGQPLQALYRTNVCLERARYCLNHGEHSLKQFLRGLRVQEITWNSQTIFANLNTRNDVQDYLAKRSESFD